MDLVTSLPDESEAQMLAIGTFDGLHTGHVSILNSVVRRSREKRRPAAVLTFEPDPAMLLQNQRPTDRRILTRDDKHTLLRRIGIDRLYEVPFNHEFASLSTREFVRNVLVERLGAREVFVGYDFQFGHNRQGDTQVLEEELASYSVTLNVHEPVRVDGEPVSCTRIRGLIRAGKVQDARRLLNRPYTVHETVQEGEGRGQSMGFPTLNFPVLQTLHPRVGVYLVWLGSEERVPSLANFGYHPTVGRSEEPLLEVHALDPPPNLSAGDSTHVYFERFLREEKSFDSVDSLTEQIQRDVDTAEKAFTELEPPEPWMIDEKTG